MHYRYYHDIKWGDNYNPEDGAHHVEAPNLRALIEKIDPKPRPSIPSTQILLGGKWSWVRDVPESLGGIADSDN